MKRADLIRHLSKNGCIFLREGAKHSIFLNPLTKRLSTVPRHAEIQGFLARKICLDLGVESTNKK